MSTDAPSKEIAKENIRQLLEHSRRELGAIEDKYKQLRAQVLGYEAMLKQFDAIDSGEYVDGQQRAEKIPPNELKDAIYSYFSQKPRMIQSPSGLTAHLVSQGWSSHNLRLRVSNMLRKIVNEEAWLQKIGHGKYQFKAG